MSLCQEDRHTPRPPITKGWGKAASEPWRVGWCFLPDKQLADMREIADMGTTLCRFLVHPAQQPLSN